MIADGVTLHLLRKHDGRNNWTFGSRARSGADFEPLRDTRTLSIRRGVLELIDGQRGLRFTGRFEQRVFGAMPFSLGGTTLLAGTPMLMRGQATRPHILGVAKALGLNPAHAAIILNEAAGSDPARHRWWRGENGTYRLIG